MAERRNMLSVEGLTKTYGERTLFSDLTFGLQEGERVALVARNGSGKSTLLKQQFETADTLWIDLLNDDDEEFYGRKPGRLSKCWMMVTIVVS